MLRRGIRRGTLAELNGKVSTPEQVHNLTAVRAIAAGTSSGLALKQDGTVWQWGWRYPVGSPITIPAQAGTSYLVERASSPTTALPFAHRRASS